MALLFGPSRYHLVWGGSWAMRRELFERLDVREAWKGTLSDDFVVSSLLSRARLGVMYHPPCMVASPLDYPGHSMISFLRRQYLMCRFYSPRYWLLALATSTTNNVVLLASLALLVASLATGRPPWWIPTAAILVPYAIGVFRAWVRQELGRRFFPEVESALAGPRKFDIWAGPLAGFVHWIGILGSLAGRELVWRGIRYRLLGVGRVELVGSAPLPNLAVDEDRPDATISMPGTGPVPTRKAG